MDLGLSGKTAIVTGSSAGIGFASAKALYSEGVNVIMVARDAQRLAASAKAVSDSPSLVQAKVIPVSADMAIAADIQKVVETALNQLGRIDILVNNAGGARAGAFLDLTDDAYLDAWNLKLLGYIRMVRAVVPHMIQQHDGRIVNIVGAAARTPSPTFLPGGTANAGLLNFTRGVAKELAQHKIRINAISPGTTATERVKRLAEQTAAARGISVDEAESESTRSIPLGQMVDPSEIAAMTLFLVSDRAASITGAEILIDGGQTPSI